MSGQRNCQHCCDGFLTHTAIWFDRGTLSLVSTKALVEYVPWDQEQREQGQRIDGTGREKW